MKLARFLRAALDTNDAAWRLIRRALGAEAIDRRLAARRAREYREIAILVRDAGDVESADKLEDLARHAVVDRLTNR